MVRFVVLCVLMCVLMCRVPVHVLVHVPVGRMPRLRRRRRSVKGGIMIGLIRVANARRPRPARSATAKPAGNPIISSARRANHVGRAPVVPRFEPAAKTPPPPLPEAERGDHKRQWHAIAQSTRAGDRPSPLRGGEGEGFSPPN